MGIDHMSSFILILRQAVRLCFFPQQKIVKVRGYYCLSIDTCFIKKRSMRPWASASSDYFIFRTLPECLPITGACSKTQILTAVVNFLFLFSLRMSYRCYAFNNLTSSATIASPISLVPVSPPISLVLTPLSSTISTAFSIASASLGKRNEYRHIIATDRIVPMGLATPWPEISGAEPVHISNPYSSRPNWTVKKKKGRERERERKDSTNHE